MNQVKLFIELTRLTKPIGFMLLFWPCAWGLTLAYDFSNSLNKYFFYLILFFLGSVLMRSAGCVITDYFDRDFDGKVERTKNRPIPKGKIEADNALGFGIVLSIISVLILGLSLNYLAAFLLPFSIFFYIFQIESKLAPFGQRRKTKTLISCRNFAISKPISKKLNLEVSLNYFNNFERRTPSHRRKKYYSRKYSR